MKFLSKNCFLWFIFVGSFLTIYSSNDESHDVYVLSTNPPSSFRISKIYITDTNSDSGFNIIEGYLDRIGTSDEIRQEQALKKNHLESIFGKRLNAFEMRVGLRNALITIAIGSAVTSYVYKCVQDLYSEDKHAGPPLSVIERTEFLEEAFEDLTMLDVHMKFIICITTGFSQKYLERFMRVIKKLAAKKNVDVTNSQDISPENLYPIRIHHVLLAADEVSNGLRNYRFRSLDENFKVAIHEAGHAIALINSEKFIIKYASIINRVSSAGRVMTVDSIAFGASIIDDCKDEIIVDLSGVVSEQVFGYDKSSYRNSIYKNTYDSIDYLSLSKNKNISSGLSDLLQRPSAISDISHAYKQAICAAKYILMLFSSSQDKNDLDEIEVQNKALIILEECYQASFSLITSQKYEVKKLATALLEKDIISGDDIYALFGMTRPLYSFEM